MAQKAILTITDPEQRKLVQQSGVEIVNDYQDSMLVLGEEAQFYDLRQKQVEVDPVEDRPVRVGRVQFSLADAVSAERSAPVKVNPHRKNYYLVRLAGPPPAEWLNEIRGAGATVQDALDQDTLLVGMLPAVGDALKSKPWVEVITPYRPVMKISHRLQKGGLTNFSAAAMAAGPQVEGNPGDVNQVEISLFPHESTEELAAYVREQGGEILGQGTESVTARLKASALPQIAEHPGVQAILPHQFPKLTNDKATDIMRIPTNRVVQGSDLKGEGQIIAIADSGLDTGVEATLHPDFRGRIVQIRSLPVVPSLRQFLIGPPGFNDGPADIGDGHGTHVAGSVLGDGAAAITVGFAAAPIGAAPKASLFFQAVEQRVKWRPDLQDPPAEEGLYGLPDDLASLFDEAYTAGARVHTNSWGGPARNSAGDNIAGQYSQNGRELDQFCFEHPDMVILFAAGNDGIDQDRDGKIDADSIGSPGEAKNCVTVGATENNRPAGSVPAGGIDRAWKDWRAFPTMAAAGHTSDNPEGIAPFSSRGPADDGRIKPDVVAPGTNVLSVKSSVATGELWGDVSPNSHPLHNKYWFSGGTSMATPLVAGTAALVREYLVKRRGHLKPGEKPSSALVKAILVNGAQPVTDVFSGTVPPMPNSVGGFGRVSLAASLDGMVFDDDETHAVQTGQMRVFDCNVTSTAAPLRVTLVWTDAPATAGQGGLTNRLYLQVVAPNGQVLNGDVRAFPNAVNNVQRVVVATPVVGVYKVRVRGVSVTVHSPVVSSPVRPQQNFAVAANAAGLSLAT